MYKKEVDDERSKLEDMIAAGANEHDESHQRRVIEDSEQMVPDTLARLERAVADLAACVDEVADEPKVRGSELLAEARSLIETYGDLDGGGDGDEGEIDMG